MAISMLKIRRPLGRLIFNMGIAIPGKTVFLIETAPCFWPTRPHIMWCVMWLTSHHGMWVQELIEVWFLSYVYLLSMIMKSLNCSFQFICSLCGCHQQDDSPHGGPIMRSFDDFFDDIKQCNKIVGWPEKLDMLPLICPVMCDTVIFFLCLLKKVYFSPENGLIYMAFRQNVCRWYFGCIFMNKNISILKKILFNCLLEGYWSWVIWIAF